MRILKGIAFSRGVAIGPLHFLNRASKRIEMHPAADPAVEWSRFVGARSQTVALLGKLREQALTEVGAGEAMIFKIHQIILEDENFTEAVRDWIEIRHTTAEYAVQQAGEQFKQVMEQLEDDYMRERGADILDVSNRVVQFLCSEGTEERQQREPGRSVVAADSLLPSETIQMGQERMAAVITSGGSTVSHAAILVRTMGVPAVCGLGEQLYDLPEGSVAIVDGFNGTVVVDPDGDTLAEYHQKAEEYRHYKEHLKKLKGTESITKDGFKVRVCANIGSPSDVRAAVDNDAEGIGLLRSEFFYLESDEFPSEEIQYQAYKTVLQAMKGKQVVVRTFDLGAEKTVSCFRIPDEENPALGCRAIRICLKRPDVFASQLRALLRASIYGKLAILIPMVVSVEEVQAVKRMLEECKKELEEQGKHYADDIELGVMIETPAAALISDLLAKEVDFFSIGTNDLVQYTLAADRANSSVAAMYDPRHRAVLRMIRMTAKNAVENGIRCCVCGEAAADRRMTELFLAMGITELSVAPDSILEIRDKVQSIRLNRRREEILEEI